MKKNQKIATNGNSLTDILAVTYVSDGRSLNATFWLAGPFDSTMPSPNSNISKIGYGVAIDTDFDRIPEYIIQIQRFRKDIAPPMWVKMYKEIPPSLAFQPNVIKNLFSTNNFYRIEQNYKNFFRDGQAFVNLSINLDAIGSPSNFEVYFYTEERIGKIGSSSDDSVLDEFTNWISIPPPDVTVSIIPNSETLRVNEESTALVQVNSTTASEPLVHLFAKNPHNINATFDKRELQIPAFGINSTVLRIKPLPGAETSTPQLSMQIAAASTIPYKPLYTTSQKTNFSVASGVAIPTNVESRTKTSNLRLSIGSEISVIDRFLDIMDKYKIIIPFLPLSFLGGFIVRHFGPWIKKNINRIRIRNLDDYFFKASK